MEKLSKAQMVEVLQDASQTIRKQASTIASLQEKLAAKETREQAEKLAFDMHQKGLRLDTLREDLADELEKQAQAGKFEVIKEAVELVGPDMGKFASVNNNNDEQRNSPSSSDFERFIVGGVG